MAKKVHTIEGANLTVKKYIQHDTYPNKSLVKGLPDNVTEEELINYLKAEQD